MFDTLASVTVLLGRITMQIHCSQDNDAVTQLVILNRLMNLRVRIFFTELQITIILYLFQQNNEELA